MPYTVTYNPETHYIYYRFLGKLNMKEVRELSAAAARLANEQNCHLVLADLREAAVGLTMAEVFEIPGLLKEVLTPYGLLIQKFKRAVVVKKRILILEFFETVSVNRGHNVKIFVDEDLAVNWLTGEQS